MNPQAVVIYDAMALGIEKIEFTEKMSEKGHGRTLVAINGLIDDKCPQIKTFHGCNQGELHLRHAAIDKASDGKLLALSFMIIYGGLLVDTGTNEIRRSFHPIDIAAFCHWVFLAWFGPHIVNPAGTLLAGHLNEIHENGLAVGVFHLHQVVPLRQFRFDGMGIHFTIQIHQEYIGIFPNELALFVTDDPGGRLKTLCLFFCLALLDKVGCGLASPPFQRWLACRKNEYGFLGRGPSPRPVKKAVRQCRENHRSG
jgi:hypothetical protein